MHMIRNFVLAFLLTTGFIFTLTACNVDDLEEINLVIILGNRANTYSLSESEFDIMQQYIERSFASTGRESDVRANVAFIISDGTPTPITSIASVNDWDRSWWNAENIEVRVTQPANRTPRIREVFTHSIRPFLESPHLRATNEEADLLTSLRRATDILSNMDGIGGDYILIFDSGISTSGPLDFNRLNIQYEDFSIKEVIEELERTGTLPILNGITVNFFDIGAVASPQQVPDTNIFKEQLLSLWKNILTASGADSVNVTWRNTFGRVPNRYVEDSDGDGFPFVTVVPFVEPYFHFEVGEVFASAELGFLPNSFEFRDEENAIRILSEVADGIHYFLHGNPLNVVYIVGSEARIYYDAPNPRGGYIARRRAEAVMNLLVNNFNIPNEQLRIVNAKTTVFSWRNSEEFPDGITFNHENAEENRVVAIFPDTSNKVEELLMNGLLDD